MPFTSYASIAEVASAYRISCERTAFPAPEQIRLSDEFQSELSLTLHELPFDSCDDAVREMLIYPLLREVWKPFRDGLTLWSHHPITHDEDLSGTPDYIVASCSPLGRLIFEPPCGLVVVQARKDDFERGWGECLAALLAVRKINSAWEEEVFGVVTNGTSWEFGILGAKVFIQDARPLVLSGLNRLAGALHSILSECQSQASPQPRIVGGQSRREDRR